MIFCCSQARMLQSPSIYFRGIGAGKVSYDTFPLVGSFPFALLLNLQVSQTDGSRVRDRTQVCLTQTEQVISAYRVSYPLSSRLPNVRFRGLISSPCLFLAFNHMADPLFSRLRRRNFLLCSMQSAVLATLIDLRVIRTGDKHYFSPVKSLLGPVHRCYFHAPQSALYSAIVLSVALETLIRCRQTAGKQVDDAFSVFETRTKLCHSLN